MIRHILNVFKKEKTDLLRDRRTVVAAFAYAFIGPLILIIVLNFIAKQVSDETETQLAVMGAANAPNLVQYLEGQGVTIVAAEAGNTPAEQLGGSNVLLVIEPAYGQALGNGTPAKLWLYVDRTNSENSGRANEVRRKITTYANQIKDARLLSAGVPPVLATPVIVLTGDISGSGATAKTISFMMLFFFVLAPFYSSLSAAIDTTAGERERRSLQSLLAQPVAPSDLIFGKWMIASLFGVVGTVVTVLGGLYVLGFAPLDVLGIRLNLGLGAQVSMIAILVPLALFVAALQILISLTAKSYKEANNYLQLLAFAPAVMGMFLVLSGKTIEGPAAFIPVISQLQGMQQALLGGTFDGLSAAVNGLIALALAVLCLWLAAKRLGSEQILSAA